MTAWFQAEKAKVLLVHFRIIANDLATPNLIALNAPYFLVADISTDWLRNEILSYENSTTKYLWRTKVKKVCHKMEIRYGSKCDAFEFANAIYSILNGRKYNVPTESYILLADFFGNDLNEILNEA